MYPDNITSDGARTASQAEETEAGGQSSAGSALTNTQIEDWSHAFANRSSYPKALFVSLLSDQQAIKR